MPDHKLIAISRAAWVGPVVRTSTAAPVAIAAPAAIAGLSGPHCEATQVGAARIVTRFPERWRAEPCAKRMTRDRLDMPA